MRPPLPTDFVERIEKTSVDATGLLLALDQDPILSVRLNPLKPTALDFELQEAVTWCEHAFYLDQRPKFTLDPFFHAGCYYPQEAASMALGQIIKALELPENPYVLDACAAPGGKSIGILEALAGSGFLISNEINKHRANVLAENLSKWGHHNVLVTQNEPKQFEALVSFFDLVVVDAPCSGEGMFRKDPASRLEWSTDNVEMCALRQKNILNHLSDSIKEGGYLIYSTCTLNSTENESVMSWFMETEPYELVATNLGIASKHKLGSYFMPGQTKTEGFYICVLRKKAQCARPHRKHKGGQDIKTKFTWPDKLIQHQNLRYFEYEDALFGMNETSFEGYMSLPHNFRILKKGLNLGAFHPKGFIPSHELALSILDLHLFETLEISKEQALKYLSGQTFYIEAPIGYILFKYMGISLGFVKNLGPRFNSCYPKEWRIRMAIS